LIIPKDRHFENIFKIYTQPMIRRGMGKSGKKKRR